MAVSVLLLFLTEVLVGLQRVIVVFRDHILASFFTVKCIGLELCCTFDKQLRFASMRYVVSESSVTELILPQSLNSL